MADSVVDAYHMSHKTVLEWIAGGEIVQLASARSLLWQNMRKRFKEDFQNQLINFSGINIISPNNLPIIISAEGKTFEVCSYYDKNLLAPSSDKWYKIPTQYWYIAIRFENYDDMEWLGKYVTEEKEYNPTKTMRFDQSYAKWVDDDDSPIDVRREELTGIDEKFQELLDSFEYAKQNADKMRRLTGSSGLNLLFEGKPGTGKTSMAALLAHELNCPMCIYPGNLFETPVHYVPTIMSPTKESIDPEADYVIVLLDDFDTHLEAAYKIINDEEQSTNQNNGPKNNVPVVLSEMSGVKKRPHVIRIFCVNDKSKIDFNDAMMQRFNIEMTFDLPTTDQLVNHLIGIDPDREADIRVLGSVLDEHEIRLSYREIGHAVGRYFQRTDCYEQAVNLIIEK